MVSGRLARGSTISDANSVNTDESRRAPRICSVKFGTTVAPYAASQSSGLSSE